MTFQDALNILMGEKDAATRYLQRTTSEALFSEFNPIIQQTLDEVNAREYWRGAVTAYNRLPLVEKTDPELDAYVTNKALEGLFSLVEKKEADIRQNPALRTSELLQKVFKRQDK
jgi:predicted S18 family serine protease